MLALRNLAARILPVLFLCAAPGVQTRAGPGLYACCNEEEIQYANGELGLAGVLISPVSGGRHPAAVILQGAGDSDRSNLWARGVAEMLARKGVAVLLTDKRGTGRSAGDWRTASFADLAEDALAGVAALRRHPGIDASRVGLLGLSQGGRVAPLASVSGQVDFVINFVGGALPMKETLYRELENTYRQAGLAQADIDFLQEMTRLSFAYVETGQGFSDYLAQRARVEARFGTMATESWPASQTDPYWEFWRKNHGHDPLPDWVATIDIRGIPSFIAYGVLDERDNVPVTASVARLRGAIQRHELLDLHVYPDTGHSLWVESLRAQGRFVFVPGLHADLEHWLARHVF